MFTFCRDLVMINYHDSLIILAMIPGTPCHDLAMKSLAMISSCAACQPAPGFLTDDRTHFGGGAAHGSDIYTDWQHHWWWCWQWLQISTLKAPAELCDTTT